jgi:YidC/Oxa1 family membrane protein insertase
MDRNSIFGFILIGLILVVWLYFQNKNTTEQQQKQQTEQQQQQSDTTRKTTPLDTSRKIQQTASDTTKTTQDTTVRISEKYGSLFGKFEQGEDKIIMIETDKFYAEFSTKGGALIKYEIKGFKTWDGYPVQLLELNKG